MRFKYTEEVLDDILKRDNAVLVSYDDKLSKRTRIIFICHCGKESNKIAHELVKRAGAFCKDCSLQRGIEKTKHTLKEKHNKNPICTVESLYETVKHDGALLMKEYISVTQNCIILFICNCGEESEKNCLQLIKVSGAFCTTCTQKTWTQRIKETNIDRYGVECSVHSPEFQAKSKATILKHYGVDHVFKSEEVQQKIKQSMIEKYGVEHPIYNDIIKQKMKNTCLERHGIENVLELPEYREKMKKTCLERYGVEHISQTQEFKEKCKQTCLERYGVEHTSQTQEFKDKLKDAFIAHYGVDNPNKTKEVRDKIKQTCLQRYGVEHPSQSQEIADKTQKNAKKYKKFTMPSGIIRNVQGYEPFALTDLLKQYTEDDIYTYRKDVPRISYQVNEAPKYYFPDIYIKSKNKIIEVKSTWTYKCKQDNIQQKAEATRQAGYDYEIWIYDEKGNRITES
jgi:hypothetical protein